MLERNRMARICLLATGMMILASCTTLDPYTRDEKVSNASKGAAIGALSGCRGRLDYRRRFGRTQKERHYSRRRRRSCRWCGWLLHGSAGNETPPATRRHWCQRYPHGRQYHAEYAR